MSEIVSLADDPDAARDRAVKALRDGKIIVLPTDSVYALCTDAFSKLGTQRLFGAKRRGRATPLAVLIRSQRQTIGLVEEISEAAERLMAAYWPGPLTLVFPAAEGLSWDIGESQGTVALRMPTDELLLELIADVGPLAVTSANRRGEPLPETAAAARRQLGLAVSVYLEGGERKGTTSTMVDVTRARPEVLREGAIPAADILRVAEGETGADVPDEAAGATALGDAEPDAAG